MVSKRIVVTGIGAVTPAGNSADRTWQALLNGESGIKPIERFDTSEFKVRFGGECLEFDPEEYLDKRRIKRLDRFVQMGLAGASDVIEDSGLDPGSINPERAGVITGSGIGGLMEIETQHKRLFDKGPSRVSPFFIPKLMMNAAPGQIAMEFGFEGPNYSVSSACSSANHAIGDALECLRRGETDLMITGGVEAALTPSCLAGFSALKALSTRNEAPEKASRPFDQDRDGFVLSEGVGMMLLETLDHAREREADIYAEVFGFGATADAHHITAPDPEGKGAIRAMEIAIRDGDFEKEDVRYVNAHGTSTELNDKMETAAIRSVFGERADEIPVSSTKSMIGHSLGAAAGIEAIVCTLTARDQKVHPTINLENPDPDCDLDYVPNEAREIEAGVCLSNSFGFGGHNSCLAIGSFNA